MPSNYRNKSTKKPKARKPPASSAPVPKDKTPGAKMDGYQNENRHPSGAAWNRIKANVISYYGGICHLCDHPLAEQVDHLVQYAEGGGDSIENLRPAHGSANTQKNPCPVCGLNCNNIRGGLSVEAGRAKIQRRIGNSDEPMDEREW